MTTYLAATGPALALVARLTELCADRKQASLNPKVELDLLHWSSVALSCHRAKADGSRVDTPRGSSLKKG